MPEQRSAFDYVSEIWSIAEYVRDVIRPADYNKLVLPFALLRRLECALEPTRDAVCKAVTGPVTDQVPASVLQLHPDVTLVGDTAALSKLKEAGVPVCG